MKKIVILLFILASILIIPSCIKDKDKTWNKSDLIGTWEQTSGFNFTACPNGDNKQIIFTDDNFTEFDTDEDGCVKETGMSSAYTFDGNTITVINAVSYEIIELTTTSLSVRLLFEGYYAGTETYVKI